MSEHAPDPAPRRAVVAETGSTNADLRAALAGRGGTLDPAGAAAWPHLSSLRAVSQTAGRGRADHDWTTPPSGALTVSYVLRPLLPAASLAWVPLLAGLAARDAVAPLLAGSGWEARTKWPNDVLAVPGSLAGGEPVPPAVPGWGRTRKIAGVLTELVAPAAAPAAVPTAAPSLGTAPRARDAAAAVVVGIGVNVAQAPEQLPVPWAASLVGLGSRPVLAALDAGQAAVQDLLDRLAEDVGTRIGALLEALEAAGGDPASGTGRLSDRLAAACDTLGQDVRVLAPGGEIRGRAVGLRPGLVIRPDGAPEDGSLDVEATAGDVLSSRLV